MYIAKRIDVSGDPLGYLRVQSILLLFHSPRRYMKVAYNVIRGVDNLVVSRLYLFCECRKSNGVDPEPEVFHICFRPVFDVR